LHDPCSGLFLYDSGHLQGFAEGRQKSCWFINYLIISTKKGRFEAEILKSGKGATVAAVAT
jgi:hypothetical protein